MSGQLFQLLGLRDRSAALHPGDDDGLAHIGQGVLGTERRRCAAEAGHTRGVIVGDAVGVQRIHLLPDGPVKAGVAGVEADGGAACLLRSADGVQHLFQRHLGAVVDGAAGLCQTQQGRVDEAARIDDAVGIGQQGRAPTGDEVGGTRPRSHKMNHIRYPSFTKIVAK